MSRTVRNIHPRYFNWHKKDFNVLKEIEYKGYFHDCNYVYGTLYESVDDFYNDNYGRDQGRIVALKKAAAKNDVKQWCLINGVQPIDLRACKGYTEKVKKRWRKSFKTNHQIGDYEDWDYVKYPRLRSFTWRQY